MTQIHHIDSSVILEPENTKNGRYCTRYLHLVGYKYRGKFSIPMMGELLLYISRKVTDTFKRYEVLDAILKIVAGREIEFFGLNETEEIFLKTKEVSYKISPTDRLLLSCAIRENATFVTIDKKILRIKDRLKENFDADVKHPKEFLSF